MVFCQSADMFAKAFGAAASSDLSNALQSIICAFLYVCLILLWTMIWEATNQKKKKNKNYMVWGAEMLCLSVNGLAYR